jgi:hypothetical protein
MSTFDELDKTFNIIPTNNVELNVDVITHNESNFDKSELIQDYEYSRQQLYNLMQKGQKAVDGILEVANQSDHPRAYEVAFQGIKNISELSEKIMDLQKKLKDMDQNTVQKGPSTVNNTMFVGSTAELQKFLKQSKLNNIED